jgi:hypothetical protein
MIQEVSVGFLAPESSSQIIFVFLNEYYLAQDSPSEHKLVWLELFGQQDSEYVENKFVCEGDSKC